MTEPLQEDVAQRGAGSFCVPKAALQALIASRATAYEICAYLTLARFTDASSQFSSASVKAVHTATGGNKKTIERAIERLRTIHVRQHLPTGAGKKAPTIQDRGPVLYEREAWCETAGQAVPDGPTELGRIRHVLPDFDEPIEERVWFGNNLVSGFGKSKPLKALKDAGDIAARLLLLLYQANDMEGWGGINPHTGPWRRYEPVADDVILPGRGRLIRAKDNGRVADSNATSVFGQAWGNDKIAWGDAKDAAGNPCWRALDALESAGLLYQIVMVLNRNAVRDTFSSGEAYSNIPHDAEPYCELDCRSLHGYKPKGEEGIGGLTARIAGECGYPVTLEGGRFDHTYAAIVPHGFGAMIAGIFRLRFRVSNAKNAGVKDAWSGIRDNNQHAKEFVHQIQSAISLAPEKRTEASASDPAPASPASTVARSGMPEDYDMPF